MQMVRASARGSTPRSSSARTIRSSRSRAASTPPPREPPAITRPSHLLKCTSAPPLALALPHRSPCTATSQAAVKPRSKHTISAASAMKIARSVSPSRASSRCPTRPPKPSRTRYPGRRTRRVSSATRCSTRQSRSMAPRARTKRAPIRRTEHKTRLLRSYLSAPGRGWRPPSEGGAMGPPSRRELQKPAPSKRPSLSM